MAFGGKHNREPVGDRVKNFVTLKKELKESQTVPIGESTLIGGLSGSGKTVAVIGGKYKKLTASGDFELVEIPSWPTKMLVIDIDRGCLKNIETWNVEKQREFDYYAPDDVYDVIETLRWAFEKNKAIANDPTADKNEMFKTIFIDGYHWIWIGLKKNMSFIKAKSNSIDLIEKLSSGELSSMEGVTPQGTEYTPASTVYTECLELIRKNLKYANVVCSVIMQENTWQKIKIEKFAGHADQEANFDYWGKMRRESINETPKGHVMRYYFEACRLRGAASGVYIDNFCYDNLMALIMNNK